MNKIYKIFFFSYYQIRSRYRRTMAGFIWVIANPIITFVVQALIFKSILKFDLANYPLFLLTGLIPWFFISQSLQSTPGCLIGSRELLLGFRISPIVIIGANVVDQFLSFITAFALIILYLVCSGMMDLTLAGGLLLFPSIFLLTCFVFLCTTIVSFWHVFYRDAQFVVQFLMNLAFYVTPIFYSRDLVEQKYQWIISVNFFVPFISMFQNSLYKVDFSLWLQSFVSSLAVVSVLAVMTYLSFRQKMKDFYINV
jgi:lipopolysaccharide transport system permease protein